MSLASPAPTAAGPTAVGPTAVGPTAVGLTLVSHPLCPYVQRVAIALAERGVEAERVMIDLAAKPDWFTRLSPRGKVPLLLVGDAVLFESAAILEFLEETLPGPLHPVAPVERAQHRAWIEFASAVLGDIWGLETAADAATMRRKAADVAAKLAVVERSLGDGPWFAGARFSLVDAAFAPVFRYFDLFDAIADLGVFVGLPRVRAWRAALADRPSVRAAAPADYADRLRAFLKAHDAHLHRLAA